ncbi:MAG: hypothetical protein EB059_09780 [Alphaproteobacteria bacterium]|nr:hypothetical protein [Alphaproteobacteria bacterium]
MRIAFLNVWTATSAEEQGAHAMRSAGARIGVEVIPCFNNAEVEAAKPDFVIVNSRTQAKLTGFPTYACLNEPSTVYFRDPKLLQYFYSFDGYASISDSLVEFAQHALYGVGRREEIAGYFNTAPKQTNDDSDVRAALLSGTAKLPYFGTNWDGRRLDFFKSFGAWDKGEIYGPATSWAHYNLPFYKGSTPFDGASVQAIYRKNGMGLNLLGDHHLEEDVISNRVFEIASVGAVVVTCRMPWLEKHFGDSLYYFEQERSNKQIFEQLQAIHAHILKHPAEALEKAARARKIFEEKFALEIMIQNAITLHKQKQAIINAAPREQAPLVSVIIKSDGTRLPLLERAIQSVINQDYAQYQIILVKTKPFDIKYKTVESVDGQSLWDGLRLVKGDYFAVLRECDEWFPQHIRRLLELSAPQYFVHCAVVTEHEHPAPDTAWINNNERRGVTHQLDLKEQSYMTAVELIHPSGYLAPRSVLDEALLYCPAPLTCEDKALMMDILARATPKQNFATTVLVRANEQPETTEPTSLDLTKLMLRHWRSNSHTGAVNTLWDTMVATGHRARAFRYETVRHHENNVIVDALKNCRFDRARLKQTCIPAIRERCFFHNGMTLENEINFAATLASNDQMRGVAGFIAFPQQLDGITPTEYLVVIEAEIQSGSIGIHLIQNENTLERYAVARNLTAPHTYRLELPIYYRPEIHGLAIDITPNTKGRVLSITAYIEE